MNTIVLAAPKPTAIATSPACARPVEAWPAKQQVASTATA